MKVKNIVFSGFAAALFVGVCGAANANTTTTAVELTSKTYVDRAVLDVATEVGKKANAADVYTKDQVDSTVATLATKTELEDTTEALQESIDKISAGDVELTNYYTKSEMNASLADKADKDTTYTKDEADAEFMTSAEVTSAIATQTSSLADRVQTNQTDIANINKSDVMQSGVKAATVAQVATNASDIADLQVGKVDKNQTVANANKVMVTDDKGDVVPGLISGGMINGNAVKLDNLHTEVKVVLGDGVNAMEAIEGMNSETTGTGTVVKSVEQTEGKVTVGLGYIGTDDIVNSAVTTDKIKAGDKPADGEMVLMTTGADGTVSWMPVKVYY